MGVRLRRCVDPFCLARQALASSLCVLATSAGSADLWQPLPGGDLVAIIDDGSAGPFQQVLERRKSDGRLDLGFGQGGRVSFSLGVESLGVQSLRVDARGHLWVAGAAVGPQDSFAPVVAQFEADGRPDAQWGVQGRHLSPVAAGNAVAMDLLPMPDDGVLVLGQIEPDTARQVMLWRWRRDASLDTDFGRAGVIPVEPGHAREPLGLEATEDGAVMLATRSVGAGVNWLEVHRWRPGQRDVEAVSRQVQPLSWRGPVHLEQRDGAWQWRDASLAEGLPISSATVAVVDSGADKGPGHAGFNPFAAGTRHSASTLDLSDEGNPWLPWSGAALLALAAAAVGWRRHTRVIDLGLLKAQPLNNELAVSGASLATSAPALGKSAAGGTAFRRHGTLRPATPARQASQFDRAKPAQPEPGQADDLKRIKGIGPVLERRLHEEGVRTFWQLARWDADDVARIEPRLSGFKGRIARDAWVAQAKALAPHGSTSGSSPAT